MKRTAVYAAGAACILAGSVYVLQPVSAGAEAPPVQRDKSQEQPYSALKAAREEKALQDARRQQLAEREAALAAKEEELKKLSQKLEQQLKAVEENRKRTEEARKVQNTQQQKQYEEKLQKTAKLLKTMRSEQAGRLIDAMKEDQAMTVLGRLDTKTVAKLTPFISQPRILKLISDMLSGR